MAVERGRRILDGGKESRELPGIRVREGERNGEFCGRR